MIWVISKILEILILQIPYVNLSEEDTPRPPTSHWCFGLHPRTWKSWKMPWHAPVQQYYDLNAGLVPVRLLGGRKQTKLFSPFFHKSGQMHWVFIYRFEVYRFLVTRVNNTTLMSSLPGKESVNQNLTSQWEPTSVSPAPTKDLCQNGKWKFQNLKMQQQQMLPWNFHDFWKNSAEVTPVLTALFLVVVFLLEWTEQTFYFKQNVLYSKHINRFEWAVN